MERVKGKMNEQGWGRKQSWVCDFLGFLSGVVVGCGARSILRGHFDTTLLDQFGVPKRWVQSPTDAALHPEKRETSVLDLF